MFFLMAEDEELLADVRFALRKLDPWPPEGQARASEDYAGRVVRHLAGWTFTRSASKQGHSTP
jgi:hypothetical protein